MTLLLALALSLLIGLSLGLLGGGGSILTVPILVYALNVPAKEAIATSLFVVGVTSLVAVIPHARSGRVQLRTGVIFGLAGMLGAYLAGMVAHYIPGDILLLSFAAMMLITAVAMMRGRRGATAGESTEGPHPLPVAKVLAEGFVVGGVTGLVGAGGGFLVVPALVLLGGLPMRVAVGTSLVVISMKSLAGLVGYLGHVAIDWKLALIVAASAVVGSLVGGKLAGQVSQDRLRKVFAWFVVVMGVFMLVKQLPDVAPLSLSGWTWSRVLPYGLLVFVAPLAYKLGRIHGGRNATSDSPEPLATPLSISKTHPERSST